MLLGAALTVTRHFVSAIASARGGCGGAKGSTATKPGLCVEDTTHAGQTVCGFE